MHYTSTFDVIIIGGGHAGTGATRAAAQGERRNAAVAIAKPNHQQKKRLIS